MKAAVLTSTFGKTDPAPMALLRRKGLQIVLNPYGRTVRPPELFELAGEAEGILAGLETLNADALGRLKRLKVISRCGIGLDNVDLKTAGRLGIQVFNTPDAVTPAVAELTISLMLDLLRGVSRADRAMRAGTWQKEMGFLLGGRRVGIVGFGRVGRRVAELLEPFGAEIAYADIHKVKTPRSISKKSLQSLLAWADVVTLHCAPRSNAPLIGKKEFGIMKKGSWFLNTSRGALADEDALYDALAQGRLRGAALDVFEREPYEGPLRELGQVILTPHIGSYAAECRAKMEMEAAENLVRGLERSRPRRHA